MSSERVAHRMSNFPSPQDFEAMKMSGVKPIQMRELRAAIDSLKDEAVPAPAPSGPTAKP